DFLPCGKSPLKPAAIGCQSTPLFSAAAHAPQRSKTSYISRPITITSNFANLHAQPTTRNELTAYYIDFIKLLVIDKQSRMRQRIQWCFQNIVQVTTALIRRLCSNFYCQPSGQVQF